MDPTREELSMPDGGTRLSAVQATSADDNSNGNATRRRMGKMVIILIRCPSHGRQ
jgi:hypothetical protein